MEYFREGPAGGQANSATSVKLAGRKKPQVLIKVLFIAQVAELVDALVSGTSVRKYVKVRVLSWALFTL